MVNQPQLLYLKAFDQVTNGHTRRDGVRVNDDVRGQAFAGEDHIFLSVWKKFD